MRVLITMVYFSVSKDLTFLDISSESNVQFSSLIISNTFSTKTNKLIKSDIIEHVTNTPKVIPAKKL